VSMAPLIGLYGMAVGQSDERRRKEAEMLDIKGIMLSAWANRRTERIALVS
jgi:hypothetical protein